MGATFSELTGIPSTDWDRIPNYTPGDWEQAHTLADLPGFDQADAEHVQALAFLRDLAPLMRPAYVAAAMGRWPLWLDFVRCMGEPMLGGRLSPEFAQTGKGGR